MEDLRDDGEGGQVKLTKISRWGYRVDPAKPPAPRPKKDRSKAKAAKAARKKQRR